MKKYLMLGILALAATSSQAALKSAQLGGVATCTFASNCMERGTLTLMADESYACSKRKVTTVSGVLLSADDGLVEGTLGAVTFSEKGTSFVAKLKEGTVKFTMDATVKTAFYDVGDGGCALTCKPLEAVYDCGEK